MKLPLDLSTPLLQNDYVGPRREWPVHKGAQNDNLSSDVSHTRSAPATTRRSENQTEPTSNLYPRDLRLRQNRLVPVAASSSTYHCPRTHAMKKDTLPPNLCETRSVPQSTPPSVSYPRICGSNSTTSPISISCSSLSSRYVTYHHVRFTL